MKYNNKTFKLIRNYNARRYELEPADAAACPYDDNLFIIKNEWNDGRCKEYALMDKNSGLCLISKNTLKELKEWYINRGRDAYYNVINNNKFKYKERAKIYEELVRDHYEEK